MPRMTTAEFQAYEARRNGHTSEGDQELRRETESRLHTAVLDECRRRGWIAFHGSMAHRAMRTIGEPDFCVLADRGRIFFVECKSATGKLRPEQAALSAWASRLGHTIHVVRSISEFVLLTTTNENPTPNHAGGLSA